MTRQEKLLLTARIEETISLLDAGQLYAKLKGFEQIHKHLLKAYYSALNAFTLL
jgi:hypothetical protein